MEKFLESRKQVGKLKMVKKKEGTKTKKIGLVNFPVGDFLIRVKNSALARKKRVSVAHSKFVLEMAKALKKQGVLRSVESKDGRINVELAYAKKEPVLIELKLVSKPGLRRYMGARDLSRVRGPSYFLISTPEGIMTTIEAIKKNTGGEVIVEIM